MNLDSLAHLNDWDTLYASVVADFEAAVPEGAPEGAVVDFSGLWNLRHPTLANKQSRQDLYIKYLFKSVLNHPDPPQDRIQALSNFVQAGLQNSALPAASSSAAAALAMSERTPKEILESVFTSGPPAACSSLLLRCFCLGCIVLYCFLSCSPTRRAGIVLRVVRRGAEQVETVPAQVARAVPQELDLPVLSQRQGPPHPPRGPAKGVLPSSSSPPFASASLSSSVCCCCSFLSADGV